MIDNKELAKYIKKRMKGCRVSGLRGEWLYVKEPFEDELEFWIQQFHCRKFIGHSEWSDKWQRNIWIPDEEEDMTVEPFLSYEDFKKEKGIDED